jgi:hypothetical protein
MDKEEERTAAKRTDIMQKKMKVDHLEDLGIGLYGSILLKQILQKWVGLCRLRFCNLE